MLARNSVLQIFNSLLLTIFILGTFYFALPIINVQAQEVDTSNAVNGTNGDGSEGATGTTVAQPSGKGFESGNAGAATNAQNLGLSGWSLTIYNFITAIGAFFAWIGGRMLDISIAIFVVHMAATADALGLTTVIQTLWGIIRDLCNILFIFGLIYIGFKTILGAGDSETKKMLVNIIVAALLINFSLYVAQVIVDFSNIAAYQISNLMSFSTTDEIFGIPYSDISGSFVDKTELRNFPANSQVGLNNLLGSNSGIGGPFASLALGFVVMAMLIIMGFVFAAGAIILLTRFVSLTFLMIFSPLMFAGMIFPKLNSFGSKWWKYFFNQVLVGPAYLFTLYFSLQALSGFSRLTEYTIMNVLVYFLIVIGFVWASLMIAKSIGAFGAGQAMSFGQGLRKSAQGVIGRNTIGRASGWAQKKLDQSEGRTGKAANGVLRGLTSAGKEAKFGSKYSYSSASDKADKAKKETNNRIAANRAETNRLKYNLNLTEAIKNKNEDEIEKTVRQMSQAQIEALGFDELNNETVMRFITTTQFENLQKNDKFAGDKLEKLQTTRAKAVERQLVGVTAPGETAATLSSVINKANTAQLETLGLETLKANAINLTSSQIDDLKKSKNFLESEVNAITDQRERQLWQLFNTKPESIFVNKKDPELASLPKKILLDKNSVPYITAGTLKHILDKDKLSPDERATLRKNIDNPEIAAINATHQKAINYLNSPAALNTF
jgi:hypothetical protein